MNCKNDTGQNVAKGLYCIKLKAGITLVLKRNLKILILRPSSLGDILLLSPCLRLLKKAYLESRITLLIKSHFSEASLLLPDLDDVLCFEKKESIFSIAKRIRRERFDLIIDLHRGFRSQILYLFSGAKRRLFYRKDTITRFLLILSKLNFGPCIKPISSKYISALKPLGIEDDRKAPTLSLSKLNPDEVVKRLGIADRVISIAPGAHHYQKEWSAEKYAELAEELYKTYSVGILLLGDEKDRALAERIKHLARCEIQDLTGKTSITELACLIGKSLVFISPDTGPAHIADGLGIPHIVLFGPTARSFGFYPQRGVVVEKDLVCRPCSLHGEKPCKSKECLERIAVSEVMEATDAVLHNLAYTSTLPKKILVIQTAFLGDIILTTPLLKNLKERFPDAKIFFLTTPQGAEILSENPCICQFIVYDKKGTDKGIIPFLKKADAIRKEGFSLVVSPHKSFRTSFLAFISGAKRRIGFDKASLSFLYTDKIHYERKLHEVDRCLQLMETLGGKIEAKPEVFIASNLQDIPSSFGIEPKDMVVGLLIGSEWPTKRWIPEGYAKVIDYLAERFSAKSIIFGRKEDLQEAEKIHQLCKNKPIVACGKTTLADLPPLFMACKLLIGGDTGTMHIGVALKRRCVVIFGPTTQELGFSPYKAESVVVVEKKGMSCRPCSPHGPKKCPKKYFACMKDISPEDVFSACESLMRVSS
ncbi:MAG: glycosyltransferase family 9 protein [bacterium]|nr:glycosyltransferase family 9 protein [bacterium]